MFSISPYWFVVLSIKGINKISLSRKLELFLQLLDEKRWI